MAIYGTLKADGRLNGAYMRGSTLEGTDVIHGFELYDSGLGYPIMVEGIGSVAVEMWEVPNPTAVISMELAAGYDLFEVSDDVYSFVMSKGLVEHYELTKIEAWNN